MFVILQITYICVSIAVIGIYSAEVVDFAFLVCAVVFNSFTMSLYFTTFNNYHQIGLGHVDKIWSPLDRIR